MKISRKYIIYILVLAVVVSLVASVGTAYSKFVKNISAQGQISITPPSLEVSVDGPSDDGAGTYNISSMDESTMPCYIRFAVVVNWVDGNGNIWAVPPTEGEDYSVSYSQVEYLDGYYYYDGAVEPKQSFPLTVDQIKTKVGYNLNVQILTESIQTVPESAVINAWGVKYTDGTWTPAN